MHRLIYSSLAGVELDEAELEMLLGPSRRRNDAAGISGLLLHVVVPDGVSAYVQLLEGEPVAVRSTYDRIAVDDLHHDVAVLVDEPAATRLFSGWSMRLERIHAGTVDGEEAATAAAVRAIMRAIRDPEAMRRLIEEYAAAP